MNQHELNAVNEPDVSPAREICQGHLCLICYEPFDESSHTRIWTGCGHASVCIQCVFENVLMSLNFSRADISGPVAINWWNHSIAIKVALVRGLVPFMTGGSLIHRQHNSDLRKVQISHRRNPRWQEIQIARCTYNCPCRCPDNMILEALFYSHDRDYLIVWLDEPGFRRAPRA